MYIYIYTVILFPDSLLCFNFDTRKKDQNQTGNEHFPLKWRPISGSSGLRESIRFLVQHQMVQARWTTGWAAWDFPGSSCKNGVITLLVGEVRVSYFLFRGFLVPQIITGSGARIWYNVWLILEPLYW